ncbi:putative caspase [Annulohypoxylon maeteangense]|uniref:putative caspase n=1 Tax=Annulohypoxylon maeteangense TaxID=1927788 RepID=UPI002007C5BD|nr:putative caspase [Annulohypoxylon maeteangense]KAI0887516.1 putative caspase [Annulohypoxylon maeteangense]
MENQSAVHRHYAILIGIDAYPIKPLRSCVRDIRMIKDLLDEKLDSVEIQTIAASGSDDPHRGAEYAPTHDNIISAIENVKCRAKRGDYVYIHFSGHGTRMNHHLKYSNHSTGDLALVVLNKKRDGNDFLRGPELAGLLKAMVEKELVVTLVLDCCFSASVYRNDDGDVRYLPYDRIVPQPYLADQESGLVEEASRSTHRDASMRDNWLLDPGRYAILVACGPHENAMVGSEIEKNGKLYGALSFFLSKTLSIYGLGGRHMDIHRHLCAMYEEQRQQQRQQQNQQQRQDQHPVFYGNGDQGFFNPADTTRVVRSIPVVESNGGFQLLAGRAHGICNGDMFSVSAPASQGRLSDRGSYDVKVTRAGGFTSELSGFPRNIQTGWVAKPLICSSLARFPIRLVCDIPQDEWLAKLKKRSLAPIEMNQAPVFQVVLRDDDKYEVLNETDQVITHLPTMVRNQTDADRICEILEHLAMFKMIKGLANESVTAAFQQSFDIKILSNEKQFGPEEHIEVRHNDIVEVVMKNTGHQVIYAHLYDLGPCWNVENILHAIYEAIPPEKAPSDTDIGFKGCSTRKIRMTVPHVEQDSCEDTIKIFVTSQPTSFDWLELPKLGEPGRGDVEDVISHRNNLPDDWMVLNFPIRISR